LSINTSFILTQTIEKKNKKKQKKTNKKARVGGYYPNIFKQFGAFSKLEPISSTANSETFLEVPTSHHRRLNCRLSAERDFPNTTVGRTLWNWSSHRETTAR
jgi:hypothetical protein